jgi:hypothetical protein
MIQINSPFLLAKLRPIKELSKQENNYHDQIERILQQLYRRAGGAIDVVDENTEEASDNETQIAYLSGLVGSLDSQIEDLKAETPTPNIPVEFNTKTVTASYSAAPHDFINAKSGALITLPKYPPTNSVIIIRNGDGSTITINPNGKTLNGETSVISTDLGTALVLHYFIDSDEWLIR